MADEAQLSPYVFACEGGLVLDQPTFKMQPGMALELENFEPDVRGGYRRINGHTKWNSNIVPQTSSSTEKVLMSAFFDGNNKVIAARGTKVFEAASGSAITIESIGGSTAFPGATFFRPPPGSYTHGYLLIDNVFNISFDLEFCKSLISIMLWISILFRIEAAIILL